jgi:hypothetical protein
MEAKRMTTSTEVVVAMLQSDSDEKKAEDLNAIGNFLSKAKIPMTDKSGKPNPVYMRGVYLTKAVQRAYFNTEFLEAEKVAVATPEKVAVATPEKVAVATPVSK